MTTHKTGTREQWLTARLELLKAEKELTRRSDELASQRQELPWVPINKGYRFETDEGRLAGGPLPRTLAASRLSLHVRPRLHGGLSVLLDDCRRLQRLCHPFGKPRRHAHGSVTSAAGEATGVQAAHGLDVSLGVVIRRRLQLRLQRRVHRGATKQGRHRIQLPAGEGVCSTLRLRRDGGQAAENHAICAEPTCPPTCARGLA